MTVFLPSVGWGRWQHPGRSGGGQLNTVTFASIGTHLGRSVAVNIWPAGRLRLSPAITPEGNLLSYVRLQHLLSACSLVVVNSPALPVPHASSRPSPIWPAIPTHRIVRRRRRRPTGPPTLNGELVAFSQLSTTMTTVLGFDLFAGNYWWDHVALLWDHIFDLWILTLFQLYF